MKKKYIVPESKLIVLNLKESIAISGGVDSVEGSSSITFTSAQDGCRDFYTRVVKVQATGTTFVDYYKDFRSQVEANATNMEYLLAWLNCHSSF